MQIQNINIKLIVDYEIVLFEVYDIESDLDFVSWQDTVKRIILGNHT